MSIVLNIVSDFDTRGIRKAERAFNDIEKAGHKVGSSLKKAFLPVGLALGGLAVAGANFAMAAADDAQSAALLARQLRVTTKATNAQVQATEDFILQMSLATGVADDELRPSMAKLTRGTKDITKAQKLLTLSMDISKGSGKSLTQVTDSISKALGGNLTALSRLSPEIKQMVKDNKSLDDILTTLGKTYKGSAATSANTFKGRMDKLKVAIDETKESLGYALLPLFEDMVDFINKKILPAVKKFADKIGKDGLGKTLKDSAGDLANWVKEADGATGATIDFGAAIAILVAAFKGLALLAGVVSTLKAVSAAMAGLGNIIPSLASAGLGTIATAIGLIVVNIAALFALLRDDEDRTFIFNAFKNFTSGIANLFIAMYNGAADASRRMASLGNLLTPGNTIKGLPPMDYLPMGRNSVIPSSAPKLNEFGTTGQHGSRGSAGGAMSGNIIIQTGVGDPVAIGKAVNDALMQYNRRTGNSSRMFV